VQHSPNISSLLIPLVAINLFGHIALSGGRVTSALYTLQAGHSESLVGVLIGLYGLLPMLLSIKVGRWVDRVGPYVPMRAGIIAVAMAIALPAILPHVATLFVTAAVCGLGFMMVSLSAQHSVGNLYQEPPVNRVANFGWLALGHSTSGVLGPIIAGVTIDFVGYRTAFVLLALSTGIALSLVIAHKSELSALHTAKPHTEHHDVRTLLGDPKMRRIYTLAILLAISWDLFIFFMPILGHRQHLSASTIGATLAAFAAGTFSIRLFMARLAGLFTEWQILRAAVIVIIIVYLALPLTKAVPLFFILAFTLGTAVGCSQPNTLSLLHAAAPPGRGAEAVGLRATLGNTSMVFVPFLFGATAASVGLTPLFWGVAALVAVALPVAHRGIKD
jgi:MFS family permease